MTTYCVGSDNIDGKEPSYIQDIINTLQQAGNTCENLGVGPNVVQSNGQSNGAGKVAVFLVGGSDLGTYWDLAQSYYQYTYIWFAFASWTASTWITCDALQSTPLVRAHDDNFSSEGTISEWYGKTAKEFFDAHKDKMYYVCGQSASELAEKILKGGGSDDKKGSSSSSYAEVIKELISYWDGEVECRIEGDTVYINKIDDPESVSQLRLVEGLNIVHDSLSITDIHPDTVNTLIVSSNVCDDIIMKDDNLIARFGEIKKELEATKKVTVTKTTTTTTSSPDTTATDDNTDDSATDDTNTDSATDDESTGESDDSSSTTTTKTTTSVEEVPVETVEEAEKFANVEWAKIRRDDGHIIECKVIPGDEWKQGKWVKVYIPSYNEDSYMYITKVSNSDGASEPWNTSITLKDYPPSFGEYKEPESDEGSSDEESTVSADGTAEGEEE